MSVGNCLAATSAGRPCPQACGPPRGRERAPSGRCSPSHGGAPRPEPGGTEQTAAGRGEVLRHLTDDSLTNKRKATRAMLYHPLGPARSSLRSLLSFCITLLPGARKSSAFRRAAGAWPSLKNGFSVNNWPFGNGSLCRTRAERRLCKAKWMISCIKRRQQA